MAQIDTFRNQLARLQDQLSKLLADRAKHENNTSTNNIKSQKAQEAASRTKSPGIIKNKLREAERYSKNASQEEKKVAELTQKIAKKQKEIQNLQSKIDREDRRIKKKELEEQRKQQREHKKEMERLSQGLARQEKIQKETQMDVERLKNLPEQVTIAFFAANPLDQSQLRLDEEVRSIEEQIRKTQHRDSISFRSFWAVRPKDILQNLNESSPTIVHFSGHGSSKDELVLQNDDGVTKLVAKEAIVQTMTTVSDHIRVVFFNTCYSRKQAEAVVNHVETAIGMTDTISDQAAREFASQFYSSIGFGHSVKKAFEQAKASLMLQAISEEDIPELFVQNGLDSSEIVIVKPERVE